MSLHVDAVYGASRPAQPCWNSPSPSRKFASFSKVLRGATNDVVLPCLKSSGGLRLTCTSQVSARNVQFVHAADQVYFCRQRRSGHGPRGGSRGATFSDEADAAIPFYSGYASAASSARCASIGQVSAARPSRTPLRFPGMTCSPQHLATPHKYQ